MEDDVLLYSFIDFANASGGNGPRDILQPIIKKSIATMDKKFFALDDLQSAIYMDFNKKLDLLLLRSELGRMCNEGNLSYEPKEKIYIINGSLDDYAEAYHKAEETNNKFVRDLKDYIDGRTIDYKELTYSKVQHYLVNYIGANFYELAQLLTKKKKTEPDFLNDKGIEKFIEEFIYDKILTDLESLSAFEQIFNGIVLWYVYEHSPELFKEENPFGQKILFLDTNIILRILGLQDNFTNTIGQEFLKYVNSSNFQCKITSKTWLELNSFFFGYQDCWYKLMVNGKVNHVYQTMKNKNVDPDRIGDFIQDVKQKLEDLNIEIENELEIAVEELGDMEHHISVLADKKYSRKCELSATGKVEKTAELMDRLRKRSDHDIKNIYNIKNLRDTEKPFSNSFENETYYFVTADYVLRNYERKGFKHKGQPYTISDSTLAFLLYYKDPANAKGFSVSSFINAQFSSKKLSFSNWLEYYEVVKTRKNAGTIDGSQAGFLLSKVILRDNKFDQYSVDEIIDESLEIYKEHEKEYLNTKDENERISQQMLDVQNEVVSLNLQLNEMSKDVKAERDKNGALSTMLSNASKDIKSLKARTFILAIVMLGIGIGLLVSKAHVFGTILSVISAISFFRDLKKLYDEKKNEDKTDVDMTKIFSSPEQIDKF